MRTGDRPRAVARARRSGDGCCRYRSKISREGAMDREEGEGGGKEGRGEGKGREEERAAEGRRAEGGGGREEDEGGQTRGRPRSRSDEAAITN